MPEHLIFFCGLARNEVSYKRFIEKAPTYWVVHVLDPGFLTKSDWHNNFFEHVLRFLEEKRLDKVTLVGHSLGGSLAIEFASMHPERIKKLFLIDSTGIYEHQPMLKFLRRFFTRRGPYLKSRATENFKAIIRIRSNPQAYLRLFKYAHYSNL